MKICMNPKTRKYQVQDFYVPCRRHEIIHFLKQRGIKKVYKMKLGQLQAIYFKMRLEDKGRIL